MTNTQILVIVLVLVALWVYFRQKPNLLSSNGKEEKELNEINSVNLENNSEQVSSEADLASKAERERERERERESKAKIRKGLSNFPGMIRLEVSN